MSRFTRILIVFLLVVATIPVATSLAIEPTIVPPSICPPFATTESGIQASTAQYQICMPPNWNGDLVVFAHGYVDPQRPISMPYDQLTFPDGTNLPALINSMGYAFAASSYSKNGLAVVQGMADTADLVAIFKGLHPNPTMRVYLTGVSEGGLITALSLEKMPNPYSGGLAACGPIGDFRGQVNYLADFRVLFDYFYKDLLPGDAVSIPPQLFNGWYTPLLPDVPVPYAIQVAQTVSDPANAHLTQQLLRTSNAPIDPADLYSVVTTTVGILDYSARSTIDAISTLGGQPYGNRYRWYYGSDNDSLLNRKVDRFTAQWPALQEILKHYETSGKLAKPLVGLHTTGDPIVPYWHELVYRTKTLFTGSVFKFNLITAKRYGHCNFKNTEALTAFALLVYRVTGHLPPGVSHALPNTVDQKEFNRLFKEQLSK